MLVDGLTAEPAPAAAGRLDPLMVEPLAADGLHPVVVQGVDALAAVDRLPDGRRQSQVHALVEVLPDRVRGPLVQQAVELGVVLG